MKTFFWLLIACIFIHCKNPTTYRVIVVQPLGNFTEKEARLVFAEIRKVNPQAVLRKSMPFPTMAFYQPRNRYRADSLIKFLSSRVGKDTVIIGLSQKDISTSKGKNKDWGVMGLGYRPGNACVASSFRLTKKNKTQQFHKVALHELGHTQGLPHCPDKSCLMRDAEGGNPLDEEKAFCASCRQYLKSKNWKLN